MQVRAKRGTAVFIFAFCSQVSKELKSFGLDYFSLMFGIVSVLRETGSHPL